MNTSNDLIRYVRGGLANLCQFPPLAGAALTIGAVAFANSSTAQTNPPGDAEEEDIIELSPFEVDASTDRGYQAQNTLSGTRLNTSVNDIGTTMTILTPDVWNDLAATGTNDLMLYTPGGEKNDTQQFEGNGGNVFWGDQTRFRGIQTENIVRNNYRTEIISDTYNAERFEFLRGPNAILFGVAGDASGAVNRTTQSALLNKNAYEYSLQVDNFGSLRNTLNLNQVVVNDKLAVRAAFLDYDQQKWLEPVDYQDQQRAYLAVQYKPSERVTIKANYEYFDSKRAPTAGNIPFDAVTLWEDFGEQTRPSIPGPPPTNPGGVTNFSGNQPRLMIVYDGSSSEPVFQDWNNRAIGANRTLLGTSNVSLPLDYMDRRFDLTGESTIQHLYGQGVNADANFEITKDFMVQLSLNSESVTYDFLSNGGGRLMVDASSTLSDGSPNPNVGRYFTLFNPGFRLKQDRAREDYRLTASYHYDFEKSSSRLKWLGEHDLAAMYERDISDHYWDVLSLRNMTPLEGSSTLPNNNANMVRFVNYVDINSNSVFGMQNALDMESEANKIPGVFAQWVPTGGITSYRQTLDSTLVVLQSRFWDKRLVTTVGWRRDGVSYLAADNADRVDLAPGLTNYARTVPRKPVPDVDGTAPTNWTYGAVFHVLRNTGFIDDLGLTYNDSSSYTLGLGGHYLDGSLLPPQTGSTRDFGVRAQLFRNRVGVIATVFESTVNDIHDIRIDGNIKPKTSDLFELIGMDEFRGVTEVRDIQDKVSKGIEIQMTANLTSNWRMMGSVSTYKTLNSNVALFTGDFIEQWKPQWLADPNALVPNRGSQTAKEVVDEVEFDYAIFRAGEGTRSLNERRLKIVGVTNYTFTEGMLKGFSVGGNVVWQDKSATGYAVKSVPNPATGGVTWVPDADNPFFGSNMIIVGALVGYETRILNDRVNWRIQLNVRNLTGLDPFVTRSGADPSAPTTPVTRMYNRGEPRTFTLTNTFRF